MAQILSAEPGLDVIEGESLEDHADDHSVVITDYSAGMHMLTQRATNQPIHRDRVLIVTNKNKEWEVRHAVESGVHGYVLQSCAPNELILGVRLLGNGAGYLSPAAARWVVGSPGRIALTRRENDVLRLIALGNSDKRIASELGIGVVTVKTHVGHLLQKLDATARTHAVVIALHRGLLPESGM